MIDFDGARIDMDRKPIIVDGITYEIVIDYSDASQTKVNELDVYALGASPEHELIMIAELDMNDSLETCSYVYWSEDGLELIANGASSDLYFNHRGNADSLAQWLVCTHPDNQ